MNRPRSSRQHYDVFRRDYAEGTLDDKIAGVDKQPAKATAVKARREYLKDYLRWLWPERWTIGAVFVLAIVAAGLDMVSPLFMRFITDHVLLDTAAATWLAAAGTLTPPKSRMVRNGQWGTRAKRFVPGRNRSLPAARRTPVFCRH